ncbi:prepilin-type N-terminal cleavage/methylation domain-containing protein [Clostridium beijerinckii]|uniref:prepilin-type N-terminal cleavage/methylation domain-containing protein n=1 Tax=Clostridium beijerinckii TaxID=1520 RepID=UPI00047EAF0C|nr:prepilin-type N-terminal cleavage/methylation domain-containing protein [Clostridium beijerinckii]
MRRDGFTLIETMVSIFIIIILFSVGISLSKFAGNVSKNMDNSEYIYEIQNLLSYSKAVCREKNNYGKITVKVSKNEIKFIEGWDSIEKTVVIPKEIKIISGDISILVTPDGKISRGNTIKIIDNCGVRRDITIGVGVDLISIKNGESI